MKSTTNLQQNGLLRLWRSMQLARFVDREEFSLVQKGLGHFHVSGSGHEASASVCEFLTDDDYLSLHYRDKALMIARGIPLIEFFRGVLGSRSSHSAGRQMSAHLSNRTLNITSIVGPVGNNALQAVGIAAAMKDRRANGIVLCSAGDGSTQQGEYYEALAEAGREKLPVLFLVHDNRWAISTKTQGRTFFNVGGRRPEEIFGIPISFANGADPLAMARCFENLVRGVREQSSPKILVGGFERLSNHTSSDDQDVYRDDLGGLEKYDPLIELACLLEKNGIEANLLAQLRGQLEAEVISASQFAQGEVSNAVQASPIKRPIDPDVVEENAERIGISGTVSMKDAINLSLLRCLDVDEDVVLYGQDIEDPKGDVFGVTKGLSTRFPGRVRNAALSEATIVGTAVGRALAGQRPIVFIQFADFMPLAANQIISELATMYWRTNGSWDCPVVVLAPCGGYKPGLGPFHSQTMSTMLSIPGINLVMPSNASDAAALLNGCIKSRQPSIFLYPKAILNNPQIGTSQEIVNFYTLPGSAKILRSGRNCTLVGWGNTVQVCLDAATELALQDVDCECIDLRSLRPWDRETIIRSAERTGKLVIVHEDEHFGGVASDIAASVVESSKRTIDVRRIGRREGYLPYNFDEQIELLPSREGVIVAVLDLLGASYRFVQVKVNDNDQLDFIAVLGSGPADDEVTVADVYVKEGDSVTVGTCIGVVEATKSAIEIVSPSDGMIGTVPVKKGMQVRVGQPFAFWAEQKKREAITSSQKQTKQLLVEHVPAAGLGRHAHVVSMIDIVDIVASESSTRITTEEIAGRWPKKSADTIFATTGISERYWLAEGETIIDLASRLLKELLARNGLTLDDIDLCVVSTGTPTQITPSIAAAICAQVAIDTDRTNPRMTMFDVNAACSGFLYGLAAAFDHLSTSPESRVVLITAEGLSPLLNLDDSDTSVLFGDAASASLIEIANPRRAAAWQVARPITSGFPDQNRDLFVPIYGRGYIEMNGKSVFQKAVREMTTMVRKACDVMSTNISEIELIVPHQANARILDAIERQVGKTVYNAINTSGNTSSTSIPLALQRLRSDGLIPNLSCLVAFGGGFTSAATILRRHPTSIGNN